MEAFTEIGLVKGYVYGVIVVKNVVLEGFGFFSFFKIEKIVMVCFRNFWG